MKAICYMTICPLSIMACIYNQVNTNQSTISYVIFNFVINYVREHRLPHAVNTSHTTPTTHINWGPMLLKLIGGDIVYVLSGSRTYPGPAQDFWR